MNINKLKGKIIEKGMDISTLAVKMDIHRSTFYRKLNNNGDTLTIREANMIVDILGLSQQEASSIFFTQSVA